MKKISTLIISGFLVFCANISIAQNNYWKELKVKTVPSEKPMTIKADNYVLYSLQTNNLRQNLLAAGLDYNQAVLISLPTPNGENLIFKAWETPLMEKSLADRFPNLKAYTAELLDNSAVTAKLDFTEAGFRAMIYDGDKTYLIDPYSDNDDGYYAVYSYQNLPVEFRNFSCGTEEGSSGFNVPLGKGASTQSINNANVRKKYRLAIACTGEYAVNVTNGNPTLPSVLSHIMSTINRVNGVYEREMSVTLEMVGAQTDIIFLNSGEDPYVCNYTLICLLAENQDVLDAKVGKNNYDIGHILCTSGGGLASLGSVCDKNYKGEAASTSYGSSDIGTIVHEMAHQFSATHTFNSTAGECFNNIDSANAYEIGSGTTVMSYGGTCNPDNIFDGKDIYFHVSNLIQMKNFITTKGSANQCGYNLQSSVDIVPLIGSVAAKHNIPKNTPFELTAPAYKAKQANAALQYNWEQYDLGNYGGVEKRAGEANQGPIMRSYPPSETGNIRTFPVAKILDGTYSHVGERLPNSSRTVTFKFSAKSFYQGWGVFAASDTDVSIKVASSGPFRVTSPSSTNTFDPGRKITVKWDVNNTDQAPVNCLNVNIYLSLDDGQTFPILLAGGVPNTGSASITFPNVATKTGRIKVRGVSNIFYDIGAGKLTITGTNSVENVQLKNDIKVYPNPATDNVNLRYTGNQYETLLVNMYDMSGRLVWNGQMNQQLSIPVKDLARGNYQIQIINNKTATTATHTVNLR